MNWRKFADIIICSLLWATLSFLFPYQAKKRGLIRKRWGRILLTFLSPAAILTYVIVGLCIDLSNDPGYDPNNVLFSTREEIVSLTGFDSIPDFVRTKYYHDWWEGWTQVSYAYSDSLSKEAKRYLERISSSKDNPYWSQSETSYRFQRGWLSDVLEKPDTLFQDNMHVSIVFREQGFDVKYRFQGPFYFKDWLEQEQLTSHTDIDFPAFEVVDYEWIDHFTDDEAIMTIRFLERPSTSFIRQLQRSEKWYLAEDGTYTFKTPIDENIRECYTIRISKGNRIATFEYTSY